MKIMETSTKTIEKNVFEVKEGRTIISVPHLEDKVSFVYPTFKGNYESVGKQIEDNGLVKPTPEQTASLIYYAYGNQGNKYAQEIKNMVKSYLFWMFNKIKYIPNEGAYIQKPNQEEVFVPFGYKIGEQSSLELSKNKFVIGLFGEKGADKIAKVADTYSDKPFLWSFRKVKKEITKVSALDCGWGFGVRLGVVGGYVWDGDGNGHAFGVDALGKSK